MPKLNLATYDTKGFYDEMWWENNVRPNYKHFLERLEKLDQKKNLQHATDRAHHYMTFNVYNDNQGVERIHLDIIPRIIDNRMDSLRKGLQRIKALNLFIQDIYNDQSD
jgi:uncharacterized circularly permuted ATP-grasp superfamily protein